MLEQNVDIAAYGLYQKFNTSLFSSVFLSELKKSGITSFFKKGTKLFERKQ